MRVRKIQKVDIAIAVLGQAQYILSPEAPPVKDRLYFTSLRTAIKLRFTLLSNLVTAQVGRGSFNGRETGSERRPGLAA